jgi:uncharacterized protein (DUF2336 family)
LFDEIPTRLAAKIEASARVLLARRLAPVSNAPRTITRMLASDDEIRVASPILFQSERIDEDTLVQTARTKTQQHLLAISRHKSVSEPVTEVLVERGDDEVVLSTVRNKGAKFSTRGFSPLVGRTDGNDILAESVGSRPDIPHVVFLSLLERASDVVRVKLIRERPDAKRDIENAVGVVADQVHSDSIAGSSTYADAQVLVRSLHQEGGSVTVKFAASPKAENLPKPRPRWRSFATCRSQWSLEQSHSSIPKR